MWLLLAVICCLALSGLTQIALAEEVETSSGRPINVKNDTVEPLTVLPFDIPRQRADGALTALGQQADITVVYRLDWVKPFYTNALKGNHTLPEAVKILLVGTGLTARLDSKDHLIISQKNDRERQSMNYKKMNSKKTLLAATIGFFMGSGVQGVVAQEDVGGQQENGWVLEEVVVTASRREERLQDVTMSVASVEPEVFTAAGLTNLKDVIDYTAGVNLTGSFEPFGGQVVVRGIGGVRGGAATTAIYVDAMPTTSNSPWGNAGAFAFDAMLVDIERVEFLKGAQGTLYGASSLGGAIKYITKKPTLDDFQGNMSVDISTTKGGDVNQIYNAKISVPLIDNKLGITISGFDEANGGVVDRLNESGAVMKEDDDAYDRYGIYGDLHYKFSDRIEWRIKMLDQEGEYNGVSAVNIDPVSKKSVHLGGHLARRDEPSRHQLRNTFYSGSVEIQFDSSVLMVTSTHSEEEWHKMRDALPTFPPTTLEYLLPGHGDTTTSVPQPLVRGSDKFVYEAQWTSEGGGKWDWVSGLYYADEDTFSGYQYVAQPSGLTIDKSQVESGYKEYAVFANLTYYINSEVDITLGARLSDTEMIFQEFRFSDSPVFNPGAVKPTAAKDLTDTWSLAVRYRPSSDLSLYSRIASGFRSATANQVPIIDPDGVVEDFVEPDSLWTYELGAKGRFMQGGLSYEMALWYTDWDNFQATVVYPGGIGEGLANATGGIISQGMEGSFTLRPVNGLFIDASFTYTNSTLNEDEGGLNGLKGQQLAGIPRWTFSGRVGYDFTIGSNLDATIGFGARYVGSKRSTFSDGDPGDLALNLPSDSYVLVDLNAGAIWNRVALNFYTTNLFNKKAWITTSYFDVPAFGYVTGVPVEPRTIGARLSFTF